MHHNGPVTNREVELDEERPIISRTDEKSIIKYVNDEFCRISGFSREELLNQPHNIVRHPDMPPLVFKEMWKTIQSGKPWMGLVKNRCKSGDHYWVNAYVTPIQEGERIIGYESVRFKPKRKDVKRAEKMYARIRRNKRYIPLWKELQAWLVEEIPMLVIVLCVIGTLKLTSQFWAQLVGWTVGFLGYSLIKNFLNQKRIQMILRENPQVFGDPMIASLYTKGTHFQRTLDLMFLSTTMRMRTVLNTLRDASTSLNQYMVKTKELVQETTTSTQDQQDKMHKIASAVNEISSSIHEVNNSIKITGDRIKDTNKASGDIVVSVEKNESSMSQIRKDIQELRESLHVLKTSMMQIVNATQLINGITRQTNLLALNAAIEAARSGEQGRGFAVVADEVKSLAQETQKSTLEIQKSINIFAEQLEKSLELVDRSQESVETGYQLVAHTSQKINWIGQKVTEIDKQTSHIAAALEEQSIATSEINEQIQKVSYLGNQVLSSQKNLQETSEETLSVAKRLNDLTTQMDVK